MSPLSPNPAEAKRMKRRATMMSTFKTYCEINTQTSPLDDQQQRKGITIHEKLSNNGNKSDSSDSVISFSKAVVDEPEDIYMANNESRNELRLSEHKDDLKSISSSSSSRANKSNLSKKSKSTNNLNNLNNNSFSFDPPVQSNKRSTTIASFHQSILSSSVSKNRSSKTEKSFVLDKNRNSEIISDRNLEAVPTISQSNSRNSKNITNLSNLTKQQFKISQPASPSENLKSLLNSSKLTKSLLNSSKSTKLSSFKNSEIKSTIPDLDSSDNNLNASNKSRRSSSRIVDSEIKSIPEDSSNNTSSKSKKSNRSSNISLMSNSAINTLPEDLDDKNEGNAFNNDSIDISRKSSKIPNSRISSTPKASTSTRNLLIEADNQINESINSNLSKSSSKNASTKSIKSTVIKAINKESEIKSKVSSSSSSSELVLNANSKLVSNQLLNDASSSSALKQQPLRIKSLATNSKNPNQESSSANSFKTASDLFLKIDHSTSSSYKEATINNSEIITNLNNESNTDESTKGEESNTDESEMNLKVNNNSEIDTNINSIDTSSREEDSLSGVNSSNANSVVAAKDNSEIFSAYITDLDDSIKNGESEKLRNSIKSTILDFSSLDNDYEVNEDFNSISKDLNSEIGGKKYSKIDDDDESKQDEEEEKEDDKVEEESNNEMSVDDEDVQLNTNKSVSKNEAFSDLKSSSFSKIDPNFSKISVSFEPSINNSIKNHLDKNSEIVNDNYSVELDDHQTEETEEDKQQQSQLENNNFKIPKLPKRQLKTRQTIVKKQSKYYETITNKTPTIIYPTGALSNEEEVEEDDDQNSLIRRSSRIRVKPLAYWRNQKLKYKLDTETKCFTIEGVEKGFNPVNPFTKKYSKQQQANSNKRKLKQKKKLKLPRIKEERGEDDDEEENRSSEDEEEESSSEEEEREPIKKVRYTSNQEDVSIHQDINESALVISEKIKREAAEFYSKQDLIWNPSRQSQGVFIALMNRKKSSKTGTQASGFIKMQVCILF